MRTVLLVIMGMLVLSSLTTCLPRGINRRGSVFRPDLAIEAKDCPEYKTCYLCGLAADDVRIFRHCCAMDPAYLGFCISIVS